MICGSWRARGAAVLIALIVGLIVGASSIDAPRPAVERGIEPVRGQFVSEGETIDDFHCAPKSEGKHPVVMLLHGCAPTNFGVGEFQRMCVGLARRGFYAMFIEYYGPLGAPNCSDLAMIPNISLAPDAEIPDQTWMHELLSAGNSLVQEPKADRTRIGLVGFSFGGTLAVITAALSPNTDQRNCRLLRIFKRQSRGGGRAGFGFSSDLDPARRRGQPRARRRLDSSAQRHREASADHRAPGLSPGRARIQFSRCTRL